MKKQKAFSGLRERWSGENQDKSCGSGQPDIYGNTYWGANSGERKLYHSYSGAINDEAASSGYYMKFLSCCGAYNWFY